MRPRVTLATVGLWSCLGLLVGLGACTKDTVRPPYAALPDGSGASDATTGPQPCAPGADGLTCLFDQYDQAVATSDSEVVAALTDGVAARDGALPAWHAGRALFVTYGVSAAVAGEWNGWDDQTLFTERVCGSQIFVADAAIASGRYQYKLVNGGVWQLDPLNWAFAFDDFAGNPDGKNSVLNTYDSGLGHLVSPDDLLCSTPLGNCRPFTTYLPRGYGAPGNESRVYPVVFMHDGQNLWDDTDCCFGHTGWEINVALDQEIAADRVEELVIVGFDHADAQRGDEYAWPLALGGAQETFMAFQVDEVQPTAATYWRLDPARYYTAGSSFGGLAALSLVFNYPLVYAGAASFSGAFWPGQGTGDALIELIPTIGQVPGALYLDHGGTAIGGEDGYANNVAMRDLLVSLGWQRRDSDSCRPAADDVLCYHHEPGATHDELAWRDRNWRAWRYLFGL